MRKVRQTPPSSSLGVLSMGRQDFMEAGQSNSVHTQCLASGIWQAQLAKKLFRFTTTAKTHITDQAVDTIAKAAPDIKPRDRNVKIVENSMKVEKIHGLAQLITYLVLSRIGLPMSAAEGWSRLTPRVNHVKTGTLYIPTFLNGDHMAYPYRGTFGRATSALGLAIAPLLQIHAGTQQGCLRSLRDIMNRT
ncbi:hypothetical protein CMUS01_00211 [Colletotrichum musicola]|uniref:Uncharacterized protein n=1 Tax=Colletotrichum musicola TaxID=2175873 RepID=A0A8H6NZ48_9PEZI|nr:hypothetical protein CMUS01_00211 [Colletotrichum musicola]